MFVFVLQIRHALTDHPFAENAPLYLFAVFTAVVWFLWILKVLLSRRYRPWTAAYTTTTSVIVPVVDEPLDLFREVLRRIVAQRPTETIVVINGPRNIALEAVCAEFPSVQWTWTAVAGKRNAVKVGTAMSTGEITVLVDSDTLWTTGTLSELVKPFAEARIGGVTTRQRILEYRRSVITRWADWLENSRALYAMPAQSVLGQVGCLPGRTIAFRREILVRVMPEFMTGRFLGVFLEVSDDRTLTNLTLKEGYRTVYQATSLCYTDAPLTWRKLYKQQLRWARGSQYNTMRMLPWMLAHAPVLAIFFLADVALPFLLLGALIGWAYRASTGTGIDFYDAFLAEYGLSAGLTRILVLAAVASALSMGLRHLRHLAERPTDMLWMPVFVLISSAFLMPIRLIGFFRCAHAGSWGTRADAYTAGEDLMAELEHPTAQAPQDIVDRTDAGATGSVTVPAPRRPATATVLPATSTAVDGAPRPRVRRPPNPRALIPYVIGTLIIATEVAFHG